MWSLSTTIIFALDVVTGPLLGRRGEVPWAPTAMSNVHKMLELANVGPDDVVYDLGCGDGRVIVAAARRCGARAVGIEIDPLRHAWCQTLVTVLGLRRRVRVVYGDFFSQDLSEADVVVCYLLQSTNERLQAKLMRALRPGSRVVSSAFTFPDLHLLQGDEVAGLYLYSPTP